MTEMVADAIFSGLIYCEDTDLLLHLQIINGCAALFRRPSGLKPAGPMRAESLPPLPFRSSRSGRELTNNAL